MKRLVKVLLTLDPLDNVRVSTNGIGNKNDLLLISSME